ncbi:hypothetical protein FHX44_1124 [Pseudonocardia hierapolitana]|uniref:Uncharacterized protein n=1 Tax=Pseudonocardia hierapolitana TaxID=1128676 RepID=A0A561SGZ8_9PSEU|nr:hypothetical protein [Pseudonocardia hierapolitana]TWF74145.1 hypothetical protein FHX44_1124 [Pseudonocardia hierapolitana]
MATAGFAKMMSLEVFSVRDPDGADEIQISRTGGAIFEQIRMSRGEVFTFDDDRLLPFVDQAPIEVVFFEIDQGGSNTRRIGTATISAAEVGLGERQQQIRGAGSEYQLTYKVI